MGRFITRIRPGDRELQERLVQEARRCVVDSTPTSEAVEHLVALAGNNALAFRGLTGRSQRDLARTDEGRAILKLLGKASHTRDDRTRVGVRPFSFHRRSPEEDALVGIPVADAFELLAQEKPQLGVAEVEIADAASVARENGLSEADVKASVDEVLSRVLLNDLHVGGSEQQEGGVCATPTAVLVVTEHLYAVAGLNPVAFD
jgi:hypothetical protein